jgi:hypothetical protein
MSALLRGFGERFSLIDNEHVQHLQRSVADNLEAAVWHVPLIDNGGAG